MAVMMMLMMRGPFFDILNLVMKIINDKFSPQLYLHLCELVLPFTFLQNKPSGQRYYDG